jgi:SAM-dependent methyltransferase/uncharacterized protein YbaR (Trm112 family)
MTVSNEAFSAIPAESRGMKLARRLGLPRLRWSLRRLHCPVPASALVLEVGAGGNPYPRANVLLDAMEWTVERNEQELITDRPLVLGLCESLPFKDKSFDFVIASHVLEHTDQPEKFLSELMRVGKAGYIETPDGWFEKMCAFTFHRLEVSDVGGKLLIRKKPNWKPDEIARLWDSKLTFSRPLREFLVAHADLNHMRFYWKDSIDYEIANPECDASWPFPEETRTEPPARQSLGSKLRNWYLSTRRWLYSQRSRNRSLDVVPLLMCPDCQGHSFISSAEHLTCQGCGRDYEVRDGGPRLFPSDMAAFSQAHTR